MKQWFSFNISRAILGSVVAWFFLLNIPRDAFPLPLVTSHKFDVTAGNGAYVPAVVTAPGGEVYSGAVDFGSGNTWLWKYSPDLILISSLTITNDVAQDIGVDSAGDIYVVGTPRRIYKYNGGFGLISSGTFTSQMGVTGRKVLPRDGMVLVTADANSFDQFAFWKLDSNLVLQDTVTLPMLGGGIEAAVDEAGNIYLAGYAFGEDSNPDAVVTKYDPSLVYLSSVSAQLGVDGEVPTRAIAISTASHSVFIGGILGYDAWISRFDYNLNFLSSATFAGTPGDRSNAMIMDIAVGGDGKLLVAGVLRDKFFLAKLGQDLALISSATINIGSEPWECGLGVAAGRDGSYYAVGTGHDSSIHMPDVGWLGWLAPTAAAGSITAQEPGLFDITAVELTSAWNSSAPGGTQYYAAISTSTQFSGAVISSSTLNEYARFAGLTPNTTYYARVYDPTAALFVQLGASSTLAAAPIGLSFSEVWSSSASLAWATGSNPPWTRFEVAQWAVGGSTSVVAMVSTGAATIALPEGATVYMSVRAVNNGGIVTAYSNAISTFQPTAGTILSGGAESSVSYSGPAGEVVATVPFGAFVEPVVLTIKTPVPWAVPPANSGLRSLSSPVNIEVLLDKPVQPARDVRISIGYADANLVGAEEEKLVVARYDEGRGAWVALPSTRDTANNKVQAVTRHFSVFQLMQSVPFGDLSGVTVGPNPLRPNRNPGQKFTFRNLPVDGKIRIYTYLGELVRELRADQSGLAVWDSANTGRETVSSGVYLALVEGGGGRKLLKLVVER